MNPRSIMPRFDADAVAEARPAVKVVGVYADLQLAEPMHELKGTYVLKYLRYGENTAFASKKSKAVPVPLRSTCAARDPWYESSPWQSAASKSQKRMSER